MRRFVPPEQSKPYQAIVNNIPQQTWRPLNSLEAPANTEEATVVGICFYK